MAEIELNWEDALKQHWATPPHQISLETRRVRRPVVILSVSLGLMALFDANPQDLSILGIPFNNLPIPILLICATLFFLVYYCVLAFGELQLDHIRSIARGDVGQWEVELRDTALAELGYSIIDRPKFNGRMFNRLGEEAWDDLDSTEQERYVRRNANRIEQAKHGYGAERHRLSSDADQEQMIWDEIEQVEEEKWKVSRVCELRARRDTTQTSERRYRIIALWLFRLELVAPVLMGVAAPMCFLWPYIVLGIRYW